MALFWHSNSWRLGNAVPADGEGHVTLAQRKVALECR